MSEWKAKRFWTTASVVPVGDGFTVHLDGRAVRTPAKAALVLPTESLAREIAGEWDAQDGVIDPSAMPFTRSANAAIDKVAAQHEEVATLIAAYGDSDLLCYRSDGPEDLVARQCKAWDPLLDWAESDLRVHLTRTTGIIHHAQPAEALETLGNLVRNQDDFALTALHDLVSLSGSLIIGLAAQKGIEATDALWNVSRIDEDWQIEKWGADDEASALAQYKKQAFCHAKRFYDLSRSRV